MVCIQFPVEDLKSHNKDECMYCLLVVGPLLSYIAQSTSYELTYFLADFFLTWIVHERIHFVPYSKTYKLKENASATASQTGIQMSPVAITSEPLVIYISLYIIPEIVQGIDTSGEAGTLPLICASFNCCYQQDWYVVGDKSTQWCGAEGYFSCSCLPHSEEKIQQMTPNNFGNQNYVHTGENGGKQAAFVWGWFSSDYVQGLTFSGWWGLSERHAWREHYMVTQNISVIFLPLLWILFWNSQLTQQKDQIYRHYKNNLVNTRITKGPWSSSSPTLCSSRNLIPFQINR